MSGSIHPSAQPQPGGGTLLPLSVAQSQKKLWEKLMAILIMGVMDWSGPVVLVTKVDGSVWFSIDLQCIQCIALTNC